MLKEIDTDGLVSWGETGQLSWTQGPISLVNFRDGAIIRLTCAALTQRRTNRPTPSQCHQKLHDEVNTQEGAKPGGVSPLSDRRVVGELWEGCR